ncbi:CPCC family cysteine-rich protein [Paenibacillus sp. CF384]|uniref:CPCC family cysteine-rich protein n=1 Tax=Paenibacillus sp. CF384 TaxID=1884382 RepID=UPI00089D2067|nr:CPCC family cysteine-rich protein [Paenibacillus sp. CF384]SDX49922.1 Cysteine-rich CPCC [Paenibacillus sp. CF384]
MTPKYTCPCCGYQTLDEQPTGTYEICHICFWEDDGIQFHDPDYEGGANEVSLKQGQKNYLAFGACEERYKQFVTKPTQADVCDPNWRPY